MQQMLIELPSEFQTWRDKQLDGETHFTIQPPRTYPCTVVWMWVSTGGARMLYNEYVYPLPASIDLCPSCKKEKADIIHPYGLCLVCHEEYEKAHPVDTVEFCTWTPFVDDDVLPF